MAAPLKKSISLFTSKPAFLDKRITKEFLDSDLKKSDQLRFELEPVKTSRICEMETLKYQRNLTDRQMRGLH